MSKITEVNDIIVQKANRLYWTDNHGTLWAWNDPEARDPSDRLGQPFRVHDVIDDDSSWGMWFLFSSADSYFPHIWAVSGRTWEEAYEALSESPYFKIDPENLKDYDIENVQYSPNGDPVDMECVQGCEITLVRAEYVKPAAESANK